MNLFVETLAESLCAEWDRVLSDQAGPREARFIIQSLGPENSFQLFAALESHRARWLRRGRIECHFRVATGLWQEWRRSQRSVELDQAMERLGGLGSHGERHWIDEEDRLTWYRNHTRRAEDDGLVVVLVGLNHASDQGGLASFHCLDEAQVWQTLGQSFMPWVERIDQRLGLSATTAEIERFDQVLHELFEVRPRQLERLAEFLEEDVIADGRDLHSLSEVLGRFYAKLPAWDLPPFFSAPQGKRATDALKRAAEFISHKRYKSPMEQKKAWAKLERAFDDGILEVPDTLDNLPLYADADAYRETLRRFIFEGDTGARQRLMQSDLGPMLEVLKQRQKRSEGDKPKTARRLRGLSLESFLEAVWLTLLDLQKQPGLPLVERIEAIRIEAQAFKHDLNDDDSAGKGANLQAAELLRACLGGLAEELEQVDFRLPVDDEQAQAPPETWERVVPLTLHLPIEDQASADGDDAEDAGLKYGTSRARPHLQFRVVIDAAEGERGLSRPFQWGLEPTQPERVRSECVRTVLQRWAEVEDETGAPCLLPAFQIPSVEMTALFYAADEEEANRLVSLALGKLRVVDLLAGLSPSAVDAELWRLVKTLSTAYRDWLAHARDHGYYQAMRTHFLRLLKAYEALAERTLDTQVLGSQEVLRRFYKAFLLVDEDMAPNDAHLRSAVVWGISPPVLELMHARLRFLCDGFPEAATELALGRDGKTAFERLRKLVEIHRPLAGLVVDAERHLSAEIKSFGLLHHLGREQAAERSLAVQTLLRDEESDDDEEVSDLIAASEERDVVVRVLQDYRQLYPFADDGLRILALHVEELGTILAGVDQFLRDYLKTTAKDWPAFHCEVMVYTTSSSPMAMESRLAAWRHQLAETYRESGRPLVLSVGHRYAPTRERMVELVRQERRLYDVAFLFHFLAGGLAGETEPALPFEFDFNATNISQFPICEYPRPIQGGDPLRRQSLLSNRRLRIQTRHADLSARLRHPQTTHKEHLIFGRIDYTPWQPVVEALHAKAQWVACIDPFVDKRLLRSGEAAAGEQRMQRKIVGFTSGLGDYGELNLSISTEQDTLAALMRLVHGQLIALLPFADGEAMAMMAAKVVDEAEEIIGLSSLRAVVGEGERIREVVGFAAIRRALATPQAAMSQLLPIDSLLHWFAGSEGTHRPDLLQLSLVLRENDLPLVRATVIECKFAQQNPVHLEKASDQVRDGLAHLTQLFAPNRSDVRRVTFDRRYWWAQLQRAVTSRSVVNLPEQQWRELDRALESLAEGYFEIAWQAAIFTFWTNAEGKEPVLTPLALPAGVVREPLQVPEDFAVWQVALGYEGVRALFEQEVPAERLDLGEIAIRVRSAAASQDLGDAEPVVAATGMAKGDALIATGSGEDQNAVDADAGSKGGDRSGQRSNVVSFLGGVGRLLRGNKEAETKPRSEPKLDLESTAAPDSEPTTEPAFERSSANSDDLRRVADESRPAGVAAWPRMVAAAPAASWETATAAELDAVGFAAIAEPAGRARTVAQDELAADGDAASAPAAPHARSDATGLTVEPVVKAVRTVPERLLLGTRKSGEPVYWHYGHERLDNRHLLVFGASGSGKTYGIQCVLSEMAAQQLHSLIIDYTDGFLPNQVEPRFAEVATPKSHYVVTEKLPLNPFRRQQQIIDPDAPPFLENPYQVASRVASIFSSVYETMGDQQFSTLVRVLENGISAGTGFSMGLLLERLQDEGQYGQSLASKLEPLIKSEPFREGEESAWEAMLSAPGKWVQVLQLKGLGREVQKLVTEFALWDLYDYACNTGSKTRPIPVVLDEIQNLDHRPDSPIDKMLREGRKFGLSLILATQTTSNFNQEQRDRLFQAGHKLFFKPADTEIERFASLLSQITHDSKADWSQRLARLEKGQCWSLGPVETSSGALQVKPVLVSVTALEERAFGLAHG
jgi:DNA phosphorothioation-dependent restriction protein DptH